MTDGGSFGGNVTRSGKEVFERVPEVEAADRRIRAVRPRCRWCEDERDGGGELALGVTE